MSDLDTIDLESSQQSTSRTSTSLHHPVKISIAPDGLASLKPDTITELFTSSVEKYSTQPALVYQTTPFGEDKTWKTINYNEYNENVQQVAKSFIKLGLEPKTSVGILAFNCPEWFYSQLGAIFAGGIVAGIYTTNSSEAVYHVLATSDARICVVDDGKQMEKVRAIRDRLPKLKSIIQIHGPFEDFFGVEEGYYKWSDVEQMAAGDCEIELSRRNSEIAPNQCAMLIFTSGTVGFPKGAMISHDNATWNLKATLERLPDISYGVERMVSYLPLNHIAAQVFDVFVPISIGASVYFADRNALKGTLLKTLVKARPTRFLGVPRVYEKFQEKLMAVELNSSSLAKGLLGMCRRTVEAYHLSKVEGTSSPTYRYWLAKKIIRKVKVALGLEECRSIVIGAAPVSVDIKRFFMSYDMQLVEAFGLSETTGGVSLSSNNDNLETCGKIFSGIEVKAVNVNNKGYGEIYIRGRSICMGYLGEPVKTSDAIDSDGWFHSGDLGYVDANGYLYISGRLKELIITAGGENIPPAHIENLVKSELSGLSNVFVVGDMRKFLSVLVTIKTEVDPDTTMPKNNLLPESIEWMKSLGLEYTTLSGILEAGPCPRVLQSLQEGINRANSKAISNSQKVQKFTILPHDFSIATGELGPTLKVKRNIVCDMYKDYIDDMYKAV